MNCMPYSIGYCKDSENEDVTLFLVIVYTINGWVAIIGTFTDIQDALYVANELNKSFFYGICTEKFKEYLSVIGMWNYYEKIICLNDAIHSGNNQMAYELAKDAENIIFMERDIIDVAYDPFN